MHKGAYPAYDGYPKTIVDWEIKARDRAMMMEHREKEAEELSEELAKKVARNEIHNRLNYYDIKSFQIVQVQEDHAQFKKKHQAVTELEVSS
jgi:hypothetical protein